MRTEERLDQTPPDVEASTQGAEGAQEDKLSSAGLLLECCEEMMKIITWN